MLWYSMPHKNLFYQTTIFSNYLLHYLSHWYEYKWKSVFLSNVITVYFCSVRSIYAFISIDLFKCWYLMVVMEVSLCPLCLLIDSWYCQTFCVSMSLCGIYLNHSGRMVHTCMQLIESLLYSLHKLCVCGGGYRVYWFHYIRPSVCPSVRPSFHPSVCPFHIPCLLCSAYSSGWIHVIFIYILSSNFRKCVACKVPSKILNLNFRQFFKICNLDFVLFWPRIWCESLVWEIMGRQGVSQNTGVLVIPPPNKVGGGYTGFTLSVHLSVCPSVRLSVDNMVSGA